MKEIFSKFFILVLVLTTGLGIVAQAEFGEATEDQLQSRFDTKKERVEGELSRLDKDLSKLVADKEKVVSETEDLSEQIRNVEDELAEIEKLVLETKTLLSDIQLNIQDTQKDRRKLTQRMQILIKEIQKRDNINIVQMLFSGSSLGQIAGSMYNLESLQRRLQESRDEIQVLESELEEQKEYQIEAKNKLDQTKNLLQSREESLQKILEVSTGSQENYTQLINSIKAQKSELEAELDTLNGEFLAEIDYIRNYQEEQAYRDGDIKCGFEDDRFLGVPRDYFHPPTKGYLTQGFHCNHDGLDIASGLGSDIFSIADGRVVRKGPDNTGCVGLGCNGGFGNYVLIRHDLPDGNRVYSLYAHMRFPSKTAIGQDVSRGDVVGEMGCTGYTKPYPCGVHLHFVMLTDSYETTGLGCKWGGSKCLNPLRFMDL